ncbi:spherulation-specific family 4 protein [Granulicoccus phenolivorans]|uniref:spherulation-specific family 4 protein n=1 Tax=Granulicoccus phenolivorans TaxID=266854 RepID=UPI00138AF1E6|nr:spherulation-specific family 4 protein [Granulicoccus phenolivorans]
MSARPAAPWYVHPSQDAAAWRRLVEGCGLAFAVINVHNGPGTEPDPAYRAALADGSATRLLGYVDVAYGARPVRAVLAEAAEWRARYDVRAVFLDQVPSTLRAGAWSLEVVDALRAADCELVALNPGTVPHPDVVRVADVTCVFEGTVGQHARAQYPAWLNASRESGVWHLIHSCPPWRQQAALRRAARHGAQFAWATAGKPPNPWQQLQKRW